MSSTLYDESMVSQEPLTLIRAIECDHPKLRDDTTSMRIRRLMNEITLRDLKIIGLETQLNDYQTAMYGISRPSDH